MKKILLVLIVIIAVTGCGKKKDDELETTYSVKYNDDYYEIYMPYKKGVGNNYIINSNVVDFDIETIEKGLIQISSNVFDVDKYYYQEGQYLTQDRLKDLLSNKKLNKISIKEIDKHKITPTLIAGIYEKNFLDKDGNLSGISLGIVLNPYQAYDQNNNYVKVNQDEVIDFGKDASEELIKYMRYNFKLDKVPILVALYVEASPENNVSGNYLYYGFTNNEHITFNYIDQKKYYMNTQNVKKMDVTYYNNFKRFEEVIREHDNAIYVSGLGHYNGNSLAKLDITITKNYYSYGELLYISQLLSDNVIKYFKDIKVVVEVKAINEVKSYIVKEEGETSTDIFIY